MFRRIIRFSIALILAATLLASICAFDAPSVYAASKSMKMNTYNSTVKAGNYVYCAIDCIYRVDLKTGKVSIMEYDFVHDMHYHKGCLYYEITSYASKYKYHHETTKLYRVNVKTKKIKKLFTAKECMGGIDYAISGKKIYLQYNKVCNKNYDSMVVRKVMKLNGRSKKSSNVKVTNTEKNNNTRRYRLQSDWSEFNTDLEMGYVTYYLKTPGKKLFVARVYTE